MKLEEIPKEAAKLPEKERASLASSLLHDPETPDLFLYRHPLVLRKVVKEIIGE